MASVQFCKTCVSVIDKVQRHMHIFTRSKCHRQAILSQVLLSHWFQLSIQLNFPSLLPYSGKFWWGIYFGGLVVLRAIRQYLHPPNVLMYAVIRDVINMSSTIVQNVHMKASNFERMERK